MRAALAIAAPGERNAPDVAEILELIAVHTREMLAIKRRDGRYLWANHAFARACGRTVQEIVGACDTQLFEPQTAALFDRRDREAVVIGATLTEDEVVHIGGRTRRLETSRVPVVGCDGRVLATVTLARDVTELHEARAGRVQRREQAVRALVQAIETVDPHLVGHSTTMLAILERLGPSLRLDATARDQLALAAQLSQIGKLFIPKALLRARRALQAAELARVHRHHLRTEALLVAMDVDPAVIRAVTQIGERWDGSGHPSGLVGEAIDPLARVLAAVDAFVALTSPRARRRAYGPLEALALMARPPLAFDPRVLTSLRQVLDGRPDGGDAATRRRPARGRRPSAS
jgi:PAS domain S-box-containing protein